MNVFAIALVLTSLLLVTAHDGDRDVIVKQGHRVVVVEYEKENDGNTKVLISPPDVPSGSPSVDDVTDTSNLAGEDQKQPEQKSISRPRELVCDAFGTCKHKLAHALEKSKQKVSQTAHQVSEKAHDIEEHAKETVHGTAHQVSEKARDIEEHAKETVHGVEERVKEAVNKGLDKAKDGLTEKTKEGRQHLTEKANEAKAQVQKVGRKSLNDIVSKLLELAYDVVWFMVSPDRLGAAVGLVHVLGFSTAYGTCVWVTFVSSYILGTCLPRQQFGMVQSRIYPVYFRSMAYCVGAALLGHVVTQRGKILSNMNELFQGLSLFSAILMLLSNMVWLEPKSTKVINIKVGLNA